MLTKMAMAAVGASGRHFGKDHSRFGHDLSFLVMIFLFRSRSFVL